jgi:MFS family permease
MLGADGDEVGAEPEGEAVFGDFDAAGVFFADAVGQAEDHGSGGFALERGRRVGDEFCAMHHPQERRGEVDGVRGFDGIDLRDGADGGGGAVDILRRGVLLALDLIEERARDDDAKVAALPFQLDDGFAAEAVVVELSFIGHGALQFVRGADRLRGSELPQGRANIAQGIGGKRCGDGENEREAKEVHIVHDMTEEEGASFRAGKLRAMSTVRTDYPIRRIIFASGLGTMIEWYDFYIFGSLAVIMSEVMFPKGDPTWALIKTWALFATGFIVRPFGAIVFGRIGDLIGRKYAFMVTLTIMGLSTFLIGLLPSYASIGLLAPSILLVLRLLQGLALGGEYGGAAVYVAEHVPDHRRGYYTSFIQITATLGLFVSLAVVLGVKRTMSDAAFHDWGWRVPFLLSIILVGMSLYIRMRMSESPLFASLKSQGKTSTAPLRDSFANWKNLKIVLLVLFGATAGQGIVWYTGQFYALSFLQSVMKIDIVQSSIIVAVALLLGMPFFTVFGALSDRIGRLKIMMAGNLIAALTYLPIYKAMTHYGSDPKNPNMVMLTLLVFVQVIYVTMVYGPIAAFLIEAFPAKIRYTSFSLPYHIGNGWFGGTLPLIAGVMVARTGNIYAGLYWVIGVTLMTFLVGTFVLNESHRVEIWKEAEEARPV